MSKNLNATKKFRRNFRVSKNESYIFGIRIISAVGVLFSGYLTVTELTAKTCTAGGCQTILGLPTCMYGLVMYLAIFVLSLTSK